MLHVYFQDLHIFTIYFDDKFLTNFGLTEKKDKTPTSKCQISQKKLTKKMDTIFSVYLIKQWKIFEIICYALRGTWGKIWKSEILGKP